MTTTKTLLQGKKIRLHGKDGTVFEGTAEECARILMRDALEIRMRNPLSGALWMAEDFCTQNGLNYRDIAEDLMGSKVTYIYP